MVQDYWLPLHLVDYWRGYSIYRRIDHKKARTLSDSLDILRIQARILGTGVLLGMKNVQLFAK